MTPEERVNQLGLPALGNPDQAIWVDKTDVADAIRAAVAAEREACAKVADAEWDGWGQTSPMATTAAEIAYRIRARGPGADPSAPGR